LLYNSIVDYIQKNNVEIIVEKLPIQSLEELIYYRKIENILNLYIEYGIKEKLELK
jgi:hypothetical protein